MHIVVTGPPASGKSTLARALAAETGLALLAKDTIESGLVEALGAEAVAESRTLGAAAVRALLALARENGGAVIDSVWVDAEQARVELGGLTGVVEVVCRCDRTLLEQRYAERAAARGKDLWNDVSLAGDWLAGDWPVVEVDTTGRVDVVALAERVASVADLDAQGHRLDLGPIEPVDSLGELGWLRSRGREVVGRLAAAGLAEPFAVAFTSRGPQVVMSSQWLAPPPDWTMGWGDLDPDPLTWVKAALDSVPHRAQIFVVPDLDGGTVRVFGEHRCGGHRIDDTFPLER